MEIKSLKDVWNEFYKFKGSNNENTTFQYVRHFYEFLEEQEFLLCDICKPLMIGFKKYLAGMRDNQGFYFSANYTAETYRCTKYFLKWLDSKKYIKRNPLSDLDYKENKQDFIDTVEDRTRKLLSKNFNRYSDEHLFKLFLMHLKQYYLSKTTLRRVEVGIEIFYEFYKKQDKFLKEFLEEDFNKFQGFLYNYQIFYSMQLSDSSFIVYSLAAKKLFKWFYQEGYFERDFLKHWKVTKCRKFLADKKREAENKNKLPNRYYNSKEIVKAYSRYLRKTYSHYQDYKRMVASLQFFIRYLVSRNKSFYVVNDDVVNDFKEYLFNYEYMPNRFYTPSSMRRILNSIKRFYDWFYLKGSISKHPLQYFNFNEYKNELIKKCKSRRIHPEILKKVPDSFQDVYKSIMQYEKRLGLAEGTIEHHEKGFRVFFWYLYELGISDLKKVNEPDLNEYQNYLFNFKNSDGSSMSLNTRQKNLIALKRLYRYLSKFKYLDKDLSNSIELPKNPRGLPTVGLKDIEVRKLIELMNPEKETYIRDRALIEILYSTGARSSEVRSICIDDIDLNRGLVRINHPKGGKDKQRVIPVGKTACQWIHKYIKEVRSRILDLKSELLFVTIKGKKLTSGILLNIVKSLVMKSGIKKNAVTHSWRVSCATEMLRGNAGIKYVQEQLGHSSIESTEKYLRLEPNDLKSVHLKSHPRERQRRKQAEFEAEIINLEKIASTEKKLKIL